MKKTKTNTKTNTKTKVVKKATTKKTVGTDNRAKKSEMSCPSDLTCGNKISIEQQVRLLAGVLVLLGLMFAEIFAPSWVLLTVLIGFMLVLTGITGKCGIVKLLMMLPYNKK